MEISAKKLFVAVAGNIGVGKTTFTKLIAERYNWQPFFEQVINNPYLQDFYADMDRWSFNLQIYFLSKRFIEQKQISESPVSCIQDRSIYEDVEIFAYVLHKQGYITKRDYETYRDLFHCMISYLRKPDLIIYLRASTWTLISRIRKRGRECEKHITSEYLHDLNLAYERWIKNAQKEMKVLIVETDDFDVEQDSSFISSCYDEIQMLCQV